MFGNLIQPVFLAGTEAIGSDGIRCTSQYRGYRLDAVLFSVSLHGGVDLIA